jgi:hypothetical protein
VTKAEHRSEPGFTYNALSRVSATDQNPCKPNNLENPMPAGNGDVA